MSRKQVSRVITLREGIFETLRILMLAGQPLPGSVGDLWVTLFLDQDQIDTLAAAGVEHTVEALCAREPPSGTS